jgi:hypothetical protein
MEKRENPLDLRDLMASGAQPLPTRLCSAANSSMLAAKTFTGYAQFNARAWAAGASHFDGSRANSQPSIAMSGAPCHAVPGAAQATSGTTRTAPVCAGSARGAPLGLARRPTWQKLHARRCDGIADEYDPKRF